MDKIVEALDTMNASELLEEFIKIVKDKGYMLSAGARQDEWRAMHLLQNQLQALRKQQPGAELGEVINRARVAVVEAAQACMFRDDHARSACLVDAMALVQKQIPGEWANEFDSQRLASIRKSA